MKKLAAFLVMLSLLSLAPVAFAADGDLPGYNPGENRRVSSAASDVPRQAASDATRHEDQDWQAGEMRQPGEYMGPDGVYHHVPKLQDPRMKIY